MKRSLMLIAVSTIVLGMLGCDALRDYPKKIQELPEPWKVLNPGTPRERFPTPRVISEGSGATIATGDLVQLHVRTLFGRPEPTWQSDGNWWIWVGFRTQSDTSFFSTEPRVASALVGLREGDVLEFIEAGDQPGTDSRIAGTLLLNVFGDQSYYKWRKNVEGGSADIYVTTAGPPSQIEIKRVCKGQTKYRTVRLFDDSPVEIGPAFRTRVTREPREAWIDEARIDAACGDGRKAIFQYGPIPSRNGKQWTDLVQGYFDDYFRDAWKKVPKGVYFEGHPFPVAKNVEFSTKQETPVTFRILPMDQDAEGNKLLVRMASQSKGKLTANPDGTWTFVPKAGWYGTETLSYRIDDGLVVSDYGWLKLHVEKK